MLRLIPYVFQKNFLHTNFVLTSDKLKIKKNPDDLETSKPILMKHVKKPSLENRFQHK